MGKELGIKLPDRENLEIEKSGIMLYGASGPDSSDLREKTVGFLVFSVTGRVGAFVRVANHSKGGAETGVKIGKW